MASSTRICSSCKINRCNSGYRWCEDCYIRTKLGPKSTSCTSCGKPPNPGFDLCETCYQSGASVFHPRVKMCVICNYSLVETGMDVCKTCLNSLDGSSPAADPICTQCKKTRANAGYSLCEGCYRQNMPPPFNGFRPPAFDYGTKPQHMQPYMRPQYQMPHVQNFKGMMPLSDNVNTIFAPPPREISNKTILTTESTLVNIKKKQTLKVNPQIDQENVYHCVCPQCYSDSSGQNLFYCILCFDKIVTGDTLLCEGCISKNK